MKKIISFLLFTLISFNIFSQYCGAATTNVAITPTTTNQLSANYTSGRRAFNFVATAGCTYYFETCGLATQDTYLRLYSTGTGGTVLATGDDNCGAQSIITWTCATSGTYSVLLTRYSCNLLSLSNTRLRYRINSCTVPYNPCTAITNIIACGNSVSTNMSGTGAGWSVNTCGFTTPGQERIFSFTPTTSGTYTLNVTNITGGYVDFFWKPASSGCNSTSWNCISDIISAGSYNAVTPMTFISGVTYYILLDPEGTGIYNVTFNLGCPIVAPPNDLICNAITMTCGQSIAGSTIGSNLTGTGEGGICGTIQTTGGVWYRIVGTGDIMTASLCATFWDSKMSVFQGICSAPNCIDGNDDNGPSCAGTSASYSWTSVVGVNYYILVHGYSSTSLFSINISCLPPPPPLPIELVNFDGLETNGYNLLYWNTASEHNNDYFTLERSLNGDNWKGIIKISGAGNSQLNISYSYLDKSFESGKINYYRLLQTDFNGEQKLYDPISIDNTKSVKNIVKYINILGQEIDEHTKGVVFEIYGNGTIKKTIK